MNLFRCIIKRNFKNFYTGISYNNEKYKIIKNSNLREFEVGADISFYAKRNKKLLFDELTPISDKDAGVRY